MSDSETDFAETSEEEVSDLEGDSFSESDDDSTVSDGDTGAETEPDSADGSGDLSTAPWMHIVGEDSGPTSLPFTAVPGPRCHLGPSATPLDYFHLFISENLIDTIVVETNLYAKQWTSSHTQYLLDHTKSKVHQWIKQGMTNPEEIKAFLSVCINMGLVKKPDEEMYWDTTWASQHTPWFLEHFNRDRYFLLKKFLHFADNTKQPDPTHADYKLYKVKDVCDEICARFNKNYKPHKNVSIDESMVGYRGKTPHLRVYMPNKHHSRFGIKLWCVCDSESHYTQHFEIFKGAHPKDADAEGGVTYSLVNRLLADADLLNQGYHIGMDNYFSSPKLFLDLFKQNTSSTGTVRTNRKGLPKQLLKQKLGNHEVCERRKGPLLCVAYKDNSKRPVLLSTESSGGFITKANVRGREMRRPKTVVVYNSAMGGVDQSDARLYRYLPERRTLKWTHKLFFALLGRAVLNAYILYCEHTSDAKKKNRLTFNIQLVEQLMGQYRPQKTFRKRRSKTELQAATPQPQAAIQAPDHDYTPQPKQCKLEKIGGGLRRQCMHTHEKNKKTTYQCSECKVTMCPDCFADYHRAKGIRL